MQRFVNRWKSNHQSPKLTEAFVPFHFQPGDACQLDWSQEQVELGGVLQRIKIAHFRMAYSHQMFVVLKTVVDAAYAGKERQFNRRFLTLENHYLFEPIACTPASGWEEWQVENQVGNVREWLRTPLARFTSFTELNVWLVARCQELAQRHHSV